MLHKCATKDCNRKFKYFGVGLLFVMPRAKRFERSRENSSETELFWLCEECARRENDSTFSRLPVIVGPSLRRIA